LPLQDIAKFFHIPSQNLLILIGEMEEKIAEALGFDLVLKKSQLCWNEGF
jgi:hypothetical protein